MKKKILVYSVLLTMFLVVACQSILDKEPYGALSENSINNKEGIDALLVSAYGMLDNFSTKLGEVYRASARNWVQGDVASDDALKGSESSDQNEITQFETYSVLPGNIYIEDKWKVIYEGIHRSNTVLQVVAKNKEFLEDKKTQVQAEARFLRGHFHYQAKVLWDRIPYVDEKEEDLKKRVSNTKDVWPEIEADFQYAIDNLPPTQAQKGRATQGAAKAYLAKCYMTQNKYNEAKPLITSVINDYSYALTTNFHDNFNARTDNSSESIFAIQASVNDGAEGRSGNYSEVLNFTHGSEAPVGCCGFFQPTQDLVNAFQTDADGLPLLETFQNTDVKNDNGIESDDPFTPHIGNLDPRLDWTVGRRGIPYFDWGINVGKKWIREQVSGGPYLQKKTMVSKADFGSLTQDGGWGEIATAINYNIIRFADVLLWAAEIEVEIGDLELARGYVNQIRNRAKNSNRVKTEDGSADAATYVIEPYTTPWTSQDVARKAVRFERRLELALEGHRYFDLIRWGIAKSTLETYAQKEAEDGRIYLRGITFDESKSTIYPLPQNQIDLSQKDGKATLEQNQGY